MCAGDKKEVLFQLNVIDCMEKMAFDSSKLSRFMHYLKSAFELFFLPPHISG